MWFRSKFTAITTVLLAVALAASAARVLAAPAPAKPPQKPPPPRRDRFGDPLPEGALLRLGTLRYRTAGLIFHAALAPNGKHLATASEAGIAFVDLATGKARPLPASSVPEYSDTNGSFLAFAPDGKQLVNVTRGGNLHFWDVAAGNQIHVVGTNREPARGQGGFPMRAAHPGVMCFSKVWFPPQGKEVVAGTPDNDVLFIEPATGTILRRFRVAGQCTSIAADGKTLAVIDAGRPEVILYDDRGKELRRFHDGSKIDPAALCQGGKRLVTFNEKSQLKVWDSASGKLLHTIAVAKVQNEARMSHVAVVAIAADGNTLFAGTWGGDIRRWDLRTGRDQAPLRGHGHIVTGLFLKADGQALVSVGWDKAIRCWKLPSGEAEAGNEGFTGPFQFARSPDGRTIATASYPNRLEFWDVASGKRRRTFSIPAASSAFLRFAPNGKILALGCSDLRVRLWDVDKGSLAREIKPPALLQPGNTGYEGMAWSPDGRYLAASFQRKGTWMWETETGKEIWHSRQTGAMAFAPDGTTLVRCGLDEYLTFQDTATGLVRFVRKETGRPDVARFDFGIAFSPDGSVLATNHQRGNVKLRDPATGEVRKILAIQQVYPHDISFSPDGKWVASSWNDGIVHIWEVASASKVFSLKGHQRFVTQMEFGADGRTILSASDDLTALLWSLHPTPERGPKRSLEMLWTGLAAEPATAYRALWEFVDDPRSASKFLRKKIAPVTVEGSERRLRALLDDLDSDDFFRRESAGRGLAEMGAAVEDRLRRALADTKSVEARRRLHDLFEKIKRGPTGEEYRLLRAVQVLELCGTAEAVDVLRAWAGGTAGAPLTEESKAALERLAKSKPK